MLRQALQRERVKSAVPIEFYIVSNTTSTYSYAVFACLRLVSSEQNPEECDATSVQ